MPANTNGAGMPDLIVRKPFYSALKTRAHLSIGKMVSLLHRSYRFYQDANFSRYDFTGSRRSGRDIMEVERYVNDYFPRYKIEQERSADIERLSEYYHYRKIEEAGGRSLRICNVGCFYCGADVHFLKGRPDSTVYGVDFGKIDELNRDIKVENLKLFPGYPLETLEAFSADRSFKKFDYVLFTRTASLTNINELFSYMEAIGKIARNVCFLEVVKLAAYPGTKLDINKIDVNRPVKMYLGIYIHNYPALLRKFGYEVVESSILPMETFDHPLTKDHNWVYVRGKKTIDTL